MLKAAFKRLQACVNHEKNNELILCVSISALTGFLPVFTGIYSSEDHLEREFETGSTVCDLSVNKIFSVLAGLISFWIPAVVIVYVYARVYRETRRLATRSAIRHVVCLAAAAKATVTTSMENGHRTGSK